ncbi:MAG: heavy metal translocating P-type ATPase [Oscillospiraceae bacterium]|nr:heavy metal translocating P-type ATPase [Oscillospiraceae bacterium]
MPHSHEHEHHHDRSCACCAHEHGHGGEEKSGSARLIWLAAAAILFLLGLLSRGAVSVSLFLAAYLAAGFGILKEAVENLVHGELFDETFLMALASIGAICIGEYGEAAAVMLLFQLGEFLQDKAVDSSRDAIRALMDIRPDTANLFENGNVREVHAAEVCVGDLIEVHAGERIPLDGKVESGSSSLNTAALTGESLPQEVGIGDTVKSGCVNLSGTLLLRVTTPFGEDSASKILALVEHAEENKAEPEKFITRFARVYTPVVVILAALLAVLPPLLGLGTFSVFLNRALNFLVISCPCALVISIPLTFFSGIGCASHNGILVKGSNHLEALARAEIAAFDKTGTLTRGEFSVSEILTSNGFSREAVLELAAYGEAHSDHPLARSVCKAYSGEIDRNRLSDVQERSGHGVRATLDGKELIVGKESYLRELGVPCAAPAAQAATSVCVAYDGQFCGTILLADMPKEDARQALSALHELGVKRTVMLTGDHPAAAEAVGKEVGIREVFSSLLPEDKLAKVRELKRSLSPQGILLYTGDGINDTPVLAEADIGIAMGGLGTDAAMEAADIVIMGDEPSKIAKAIQISRKTQHIAKENIVFSVAVKVIILLLSSLGMVQLWAAVFADVGVCMLAILNSLRAMR